MYYGSRISNNISETPEGYLICHGAPLCRTATKVPQLYKGSEVGLRKRDVVEVYREPKEVLSAKFLASLEGKPITDAHPPKFLDSTNAKWHTKGHAQNIRVGAPLSNGEQCIIGDLIITDEELIHKIRSGVRELSVGYICEYVDNFDDSFTQTKLAANHIAVVESGRAGSDIRIYDSDTEPDDEELGVAEEMVRSGEPKSYAELADDINNRMNGGNVRKKSELSAIREFIQDSISKAVKDALAQKLPQRDNMQVESFSTAFEVGEHPALEPLRKMRSFIEQSNDPEIIYNFNNTVRSLKRMGNNLVPMSDGMQPMQPNRQAQKANAAFEKAVNDARERLMAKHGHKDAEKFKMRTNAADSTSRLPAEEIGDEWNRLGDDLRNGKRPR